jgi:hypothetical protein
MKRSEIVMQRNRRSFLKKRAWATGAFVAGAGLFGFAVAMIPATPAQAQVQADTGSIFKVFPTPNENGHFNNDLFAASASSPNDIWAVGESTIHFDGTKWTVFPAPMINGDNGAFLQGVVAISPTLAWTAGNVIDGPSAGQLIEQWNGTEWSVFPGPSFTTDEAPEIFAMTATSANDVWAVGNLAKEGVGFSLFEHFDGTAWTAKTVLAPDFQSLDGASADAIDDAWAVGFKGIPTDHTFATHWDGKQWKSVATPNAGNGRNRLLAVLALGPKDAWAVGFSTPVAREAATLTLIEHWDGTSWKVVPSPNVGPNSVSQSNRLLGLTANSANDIWAFGSYFADNGSGHQMTLVLHWNGTNWTIAPSPDPTKGTFLDDVLFAGVVPSPGDVWIFGSEDEASPTIDFATLAIHATTGR